MFPGFSTSSSLGWLGAARDLTVTAVEPITENYLRLRCDDGGLLSGQFVRPTTCAELAFLVDGGTHRRYYTLVDPDPAAGTLALEFACRGGIGARWAQTAIIGDRLAARLAAPRFDLPRPVDGWLIAGDASSLPAVNSLLGAIAASDEPDVPVTIWMEYRTDDEFTLPLRAHEDHRVEWVARGADGSSLPAVIRADAFAAAGYRGWVGTEAGATRRIADLFRHDYGLGRAAVTAQGYWVGDGAGVSTRRVMLAST
ncbi:MAG: siderophore-interacting protein [Gordonia sp. (in: high G+C Gram-positive bacteria)]|uniref:siderophore-interacting protein n=1 Tax=Gordonia sp. (in: high G+C Gram-positive bacteria) TaxID=84139 RepID=UPI0039E71BAE